MSAAPVPKAALPAWQRLCAALSVYQPPCASEPDLWWDTDREAVEAALYGCQRCQVLEPCQRYAEAADERFGVWGAIDRTGVAR